MSSKSLGFPKAKDHPMGGFLSGRTNILYQNDDAFIPALQKRGNKPLGCWEAVITEATNEHCGYVNLIKIFLDFSVQKGTVCVTIWKNLISGIKCCIFLL